MHPVKKQTWLSQQRQARGMTQQQVAELTGLHQAAYCNIESGKRKPSVKIAKRIGEVLGFDWTILFDEAGIECDEEEGEE